MYHLYHIKINKKNLVQISKKITYISMNKTLLIGKLIKVCGLVDRKNADPSNPEPWHHLEDTVMYQALRMLTNKQLNKLIAKQKNLI